jgi:putative transposase
MILPYKYRLKGKRAARQLRRFAWASNQVWNYCVSVQRKVQRNWKEGISTGWLSHFDLTKLTSGSSVDLGLSAQTVQGVCKQFIKSRDTHRKCPKFRKSVSSKRSLGWIPFQKQSRKITSSSVTYLGNVYKFFGAKRRPSPTTAKGGCFVEDARGRWWVAYGR